MLKLPTDGDDAEYLGTYPSLDDYFRAVLGELVDPSGQWLLDLLDMRRVRERFEGAHFHYYQHSGTGHVFRVHR